MDVTIVRARKAAGLKPCASEPGISCRIMDRESIPGNAHECARWNMTSALQSETSDNARSVNNDLEAVIFVCGLKFETKSVHTTRSRFAFGAPVSDGFVIDAWQYSN